MTDSDRRRWGTVISTGSSSVVVYRDYWYPDETPDPGPLFRVVMDDDLAAAILTDPEVRAAVLKAARP